MAVCCGGAVVSNALSYKITYLYITHKPSGVKGFTLIELLISLSIVLLMASLAYPNLSSFYSRHKANSDAESMFTLLQRARTEAIRRQGNITICSSLDKVNCDSDWQQSIIVFNDHNKNQIKELNEELLVVSDVSAYLNVNRSHLNFSPFLQASSVTATLSFCLPNRVGVQAIIISNVGRIRIEKSGDKIKCQN